MEASGCRFSGPTVALGRGREVLGYQALTWGQGGPASKVDRASSPESDPTRPTWTAGESPRGFNPPPQCGGTWLGRRGRRIAYGVFSGPALWDFPSGKGDRSTRLNTATLAGISGSARHGWLTFGGRIRALPPPPRSRALAGGSFNPRRRGETLGWYTR